MSYVAVCPAAGSSGFPAFSHCQPRSPHLHTAAGLHAGLGESRTDALPRRRRHGHGASGVVDLDRADRDDARRAAGGACARALGSRRASASLCRPPADVRAAPYASASQPRTAGGGPLRMHLNLGAKTGIRSSHSFVMRCRAPGPVVRVAPGGGGRRGRKGPLRGRTRPGADWSMAIVHRRAHPVRPPECTNALATLTHHFAAGHAVQG